MIYEISVNDIPYALNSGASLIIISNDSTSALVSSTTPISNAVIHVSSDIDSLLTEPKWRQPCKDCEI